MTPAQSPDGNRSRRGQPVVDRVRRLTLERLAEEGFERLSIPEIAALAGLNKTSVYRRWPTKEALVRDSLLAAMGPAEALPDTGTLHGDLAELTRGAAAFAASPVGMAVFRVLVADHADVGIGGAGLFRQGEAALRPVFERAVARGELRDGADLGLIAAAISGTLLQRLTIERLPVTDREIEALIDLVLLGATPRAR